MLLLRLQLLCWCGAAAVAARSTPLRSARGGTLPENALSLHRVPSVQCNTSSARTHSYGTEWERFYTPDLCLHVYRSTTVYELAEVPVYRHDIRTQVQQYSSLRDVTAVIMIVAWSLLGAWCSADIMGGEYAPMIGASRRTKQCTTTHRRWKPSTVRYIPTKLTC